MLTGDKGETALQIGLACGLYDSHFKLFKVEEEDDKISECLDSLKDQVRNTEKKICLAISGSCLPTIFNSESLSQIIFDIFCRCESVIVYRSSPSQKA